MKYLIKNKHWNLVEDYNLDKILYLLIDRPNFIIEKEIYVWHNNKNKWNRFYDLPAFMTRAGTLNWFVDNKLFRKNKNKYSALYFDGKQEFSNTIF